MLKTTKMNLAWNGTHTLKNLDEDLTDNISNMTEFPRSFRTDAILDFISYYKKSDGYDHKCTL